MPFTAVAMLLAEWEAEKAAAARICLCRCWRGASCTVCAANAGHDDLSPLLPACLSNALIVRGYNDLAQGLAEARLLPCAHDHGHPQDLDERFARKANGLESRRYDSNLQQGLDDLN